MANETPRSSMLPQILVGVVLALLVGGSAPWWMKEFRRQPNVPDNPGTYRPADNPSGSHYDPSSNPPKPTGPVKPVSDPEPSRTDPAADVGGPIEVRCDVNPLTIPAGGTAELIVQASSPQNTPITAANVKVLAGTGVFTASGGTEVLGTTGSDGSFHTVWRAPQGVAMGIGFSVSIAKPGFQEGSNECHLQVQ